MWLVASDRLMTLPELVEAIAVNEGDATLDLDSTVNDGADLVKLQLGFVKSAGLRSI